MTSQAIQLNDNSDNYNKRIEQNIRILEILADSKSIDTVREDTEWRMVVDSLYKQQEVFGGTEKWNDSFIKLITILPDNYDTQVLTSLTKAENERFKNMGGIFSKIPSRARIFQEVFSETSELVVAREGKNVNGEDYIFGCLASPRLISEDLIKNLRLCDFSDDKRKPLKRFEKISDEQTILALKYIFLNMEPLGDKDGRVFILKPVVTSDSKINEVLQGYNNECPGKVVIISRTGVKDVILSKGKITGFYLNRKRMAIYDDIYSAHRALVSIDSGYDEESKLLSSISLKIELIGEKLFNWRRNTDEKIKQEISKELLKLCKEISGSFSKMQNKYKKEIATILSDIFELHSHRANPRAHLLKLQSAYVRIKRRFDEFSRILMYEGKDQKLVEKEVFDARLKMDTVYNGINQIDKELVRKNGNLPTYREDKIFFELGSFVNLTSTIHFSPYIELSSKIKRVFTDIVDESSRVSRSQALCDHLIRIKLDLFLENSVLRGINNALKADSEKEKIISICKNLKDTVTKFAISHQSILNDNQKDFLRNIYKLLADSEKNLKIENKRYLSPDSTVRLTLKNILDLIVDEFRS